MPLKPPLSKFAGRIFKLASGRYAELLLIATIIFAYLNVFRPLFTPFFYESDQLIFLYDADRMLHGDVIYSDFFQFTFPGTQTLYYFLFRVFGPEYWVLGLVIIAISAITFWICLLISREVIKGELVYLPAVLFVFAGLRWFGIDGSHRMLSPIFILLAVLILLRGHGMWHACLAGVSCAFASFFTQPRGVLGMIACLLFICIDGIARREKWKPSVLKCLAAIGGFGVGITLLCGYFIYTAGLDAFVASTIIHPGKYYGLHPENTYGIYFIELRKALADIQGPGRAFAAAAAVFHAIILPIVNIIFAVFFWLKRKSHSWEYWRGPVLLAITGTILYLGTTAPMHLRFFSISIPTLILMIWLLSQSAFFARHQRLFTAIVTVILVFFGFFQVILYQIRSDISVFETRAGKLATVKPNDQFERFIWLQNHTMPGDYVYEVYEPMVYFPLRLRNPTRIGQIFPYAYTPAQHVAEAIGDLEKNHPRYIVWDNSYNLPPESRRPDDPTGLLSAYVMENYSPIDRIYIIGGHPIQIWEIKTR